MRKTVKDYVKICCTFQQTKERNQKPKGLLQPIKLPESKWEVNILSFVQTLPETKNGNSGILNVVWKLAKTIRIMPIKLNFTASEVSMKFKEHIHRNYRLPSKIISSRDSLFTSKFWKALFKPLGTKLAPLTAYNLQKEGQSEIDNRKVEEMIEALTNYKKDNLNEHFMDFEVA